MAGFSPVKAERILLLGGTREAVALARTLTDEGHEVTVSLAGRTKEPRPTAGAVRVGGFGGPTGLATWLVDNCVDRLIDATHPFATRISANAQEAAQRTGVALERVERPAWRARSGDRWTCVRSIACAVPILPAEATVLLALGSQHIAPFAARDDVTFIVRMVDRPAVPPALPRHRLLIGRPALSWPEEAAMLQREGVSMIVCRNSGGPGAYAKIEAARHLALPVVMIERPAS